MSVAEALYLHGRMPLPLVDKEPAVRRWKPFQTRRPDLDVVLGMFGDGRVNGIGVLHHGDLVARDWDSREAYQRWQERHGAVASALPTCRTGRGYRAYAEWPSVKYRKFEDGEVIAEPTHYSVLPPSLHPNGSQYVWVTAPWDGGGLPAVNPCEAGFYPQGVECPAHAIHQAHQVHQTHQTQSIDKSPPPRPENDDMDALIARTLPTAEGQRNHRVFGLMRELRGAGFVKVLDCRPYVRQWWECAFDVIGTKAFEDTWGDFITAWDRFDPDKGGIGEALSRARESAPPPEVAEYGPRLRLLAAVCRELQRAAGDRAFFLSCQTAADCTGVDAKQSNRDLTVLRGDGLLVLVRKGMLRGEDGRRRASEWRWRGAL